MSRVSAGSFAPRNGHILVVGIGARISGCQNQKELSLEDQEDNAKESLKSIYDGPATFRVIATKGKGERLDRPELLEFEAAYRSGKFDLFIFDDLSRLIRGGEANRLLGVGVDHGVRTISIADGIDTVDENWEVDSLNACSENVAHNQRTSMRIKQKMMNRFKKTGATARRRVLGYIVPPGAKTYDDWQKNPDAEPHILEGARILRRTLNGEAVADYFRRNQVPVGPYARNMNWDGTMVLRFYRNTILKGMPQRGLMTSVKHHGTGKRSSMKSPKGPNYYSAPHLAFFTAEEFDCLVEALRRANANRRRKKINGVDPRWRVSRKRTVFPAQHALCWYCGYHFVRGGNGQPEWLMCSKSRERHCWNSMAFDGRIATKRLVSAISRELYALPEFDRQFAEMVCIAHERRSGSQAARLQKLQSDEADLSRKIENFKTMLAKYGPSEVLVTGLRELEQTEQALRFERQNLDILELRELVLPKSVGELREILEDKFRELAVESPEFGDLMRQLVPEFYVYLVRLLDGGHPYPRAKVKLDLGAVMPDIQYVPGLSRLLTRELTLDLFDPPQRAAIREEAAQLADRGLHQREIGKQIVDHPPQAVVQKALVLHRRMKEMGLDSPFIVLHEPPSDYTKLRRHRHPGYCFCCRDGYERPQL